MSLRAYQSRSRVVELDEVPDVVAIRGASDAAPASVEGGASFEQAGWRFVKSAEPASPRGARILRKRGGELVLHLNRATVKFRDEVLDDEVERTLVAAGARTVRRLSIARNAFTVEFAPERDLFDGLASLAALPTVQFAEPELLEAVGHR